MHYPTDMITHTTAFVTPVVEHCMEREIAQWVHHEESIRRPIAPRVNALTTELHLAPDKMVVTRIYYAVNIWQCTSSTNERVFDIRTQEPKPKPVALSLICHTIRGCRNEVGMGRGHVPPIAIFIFLFISLF